MNFNDHSNLLGRHATLSASQYHWVNYDEDHMIERYRSMKAAELGTILHDFASRCVHLKQHLPEDGSTLSLFVNDVIDGGMKSEQPLFYSENIFGTTDAISFNGSELKIFDLKTGVTKASFLQLEIYTALFCLEYDVSPKDISIELRLYKQEVVEIVEPEIKDILQIMDKIISFDELIEKLKKEDQ